MGVTAGAMTKCYVSSQRPSPLVSPLVKDSIQQDSPSPFLRLGRSLSSSGFKQGAAGNSFGLAAESRPRETAQFPEKIVVTTLRADMVLVSETTRQVVLLELTVP